MWGLIPYGYTNAFLPLCCFYHGNTNVCSCFFLFQQETQTRFFPTASHKPRTAWNSWNHSVFLTSKGVFQCTVSARLYKEKYLFAFLGFLVMHNLHGRAQQGTVQIAQPRRGCASARVLVWRRLARRTGSGKGTSRATRNRHRWGSRWRCFRHFPCLSNTSLGTDLGRCCHCGFFLASLLSSAFAPRRRFIRVGVLGRSCVFLPLSFLLFLLFSRLGYVLGSSRRCCGTSSPTLPSSTQRHLWDSSTTSSYSALRDFGLRASSRDSRLRARLRPDERACSPCSLCLLCRSSTVHDLPRRRSLDRDRCDPRKLDLSRSVRQQT